MLEQYLTKLQEAIDTQNYLSLTQLQEILIVSKEYLKITVQETIRSLISLDGKMSELEDRSHVQKLGELINQQQQMTQSAITIVETMDSKEAFLQAVIQSNHSVLVFIQQCIFLCHQSNTILTKLLEVLKI